MKNFFLVLASVLLFSLFFYMVGGLRENKPDLRLKGESFFEGLRIVQKKDGVQNWILTAKRANISKDGDEAELSGVEVEVKNRGILIFAEKGLYHLNSKKMFVEGTITARNKDYSITTAELEISGAEELMKTDKEVRIEGKKFILQGKGMEIDNNEEKMRILSNVKAVFNN